MIRGIYLDNSMTTRPSDKAVSSMLSFFTERWGNPASPHQMGQELFPAISEALKEVYGLLGAADSDTILFTSSGAEAANHAILSAYFDITRSTGKNQFITTNIEEAPILMSVNRLEQLGCVTKMISADKNGCISPEAVAEAINPRTAQLSMSWANGLTGVIHPVAEIAKLCRTRGIRFHLDATHVLGKIFYELKDIDTDLISFNGDHLHAPQGTGGLYIKQGVKCSPFITGGLEQAGHRAGSINIPGLVSLGKASLEAKESLDYVCTEVVRLRNKLEDGIQAMFPDAIVFFREQERLPHCTTIGFPGIANESLLFALNRRNVFACMGGGSFQQISLLLTASGIPETLAQTALNFSLSRYTTEDEVDRAIEIIGDAAKRLRKASKALL